MATSLLSAKGVGAVSAVNRYLPQIDIWVDAMGVPFPVDFLTALNTFVSRGVGDGWISSCPGVFCFAAPLLSASGKIISVSDTTHQLTLSGSYVLSPYFGIKGDGATFYASNGRATNTESWANINNHCLGMFMQSGDPDTGTMGANSSGARMGVLARNGLNKLQIYPAFGTNSNNIDVLTSQGAAGYSRTSAAGGFASGSGIQIDWTNTTGSIPTGNMFFWRFVNDYSPNEASFGVYGQMTLAQWISWNNACYEFHSTFDTLRPINPTQPSGDNCFDVTTTYPVSPWRASRLATPPASNAIDKTTWPYGPATEVNGTLAGNFLTSIDTRLLRRSRAWCNRARTSGTNDNGIQDGISRTIDSTSFDCTVGYTTISQAIGATLVQCAYLAGLDARNDVRLTTFQAASYPAGCGFLDIADHYGFDTSGWAPYAGDNTSLYTDVNINTGAVGHNAYFAANADSIFTTAYGDGRLTAFGIVPLAVNRITALSSGVRRGVWLDTEPKDGRTGDQLLEMMTGLSQVHVALGLDFVTSGNDKSTSTSSGWNSVSAPLILALPGLAYTNIVCPRNAASLADCQASIQAQHALFGASPNGAKLVIHAIQGPQGQETPSSYVDYAYSFAVSNSYSGSYVTAGRATPGGQLSLQRNQVVARINGLPTS